MVSASPNAFFEETSRDARRPLFPSVRNFPQFGHRARPALRPPDNDMVGGLRAADVSWVDASIPARVGRILCVRPGHHRLLSLAAMARVRRAPRRRMRTVCHLLVRAPLHGGVVRARGVLACGNHQRDAEHSGVSGAVWIRKFESVRRDAVLHAWPLGGCSHRESALLAVRDSHPCLAGRV